MLYDQLLRSLQQGQEDYSTLSSRLATGKKILAPSDDVMGTLRAMDYRVSISDNDQFKRNVDGASVNLTLTSTVLTSVSDTVAKARDLALNGAGGISDPDIRASLSQEAAQLRDHLYDMSITKTGDRYLFGGFRTNAQPYAAGTYDYQGDNGVINVPIDRSAVMPMNVPGSDVFSYSLPAPATKQISGGLNVHYTPGAGTTVNVEIRDATDTTVMDNFSFSNVIQMTDLLSTAIGSNDTARIEALAEPFSQAQGRVNIVQADVGARVDSLKDQTTLLGQSTNSLKNTLSSTEDADMTETAMQLQKADVTLQALRATSAKVLSQSLLDFLQ